MSGQMPETRYLIVEQLTRIADALENRAEPDPCRARCVAPKDHAKVLVCELEKGHEGQHESARFETVRWQS